MRALLRFLDARRLRELAGSDTGRAAGLAAAVIVGNVLALAFTVVFARILGGSGYGSLAALVSSFIILMVPGQALQTTVAREVSAELAAGDPAAGAGVRRWMARLAIAGVGVVAVSVLAREVLADVIGVHDLPWAAAATLPTGLLWLILSVERGALQGFQEYRTVGVSIAVEQAARLMFGVMLVLAVSGDEAEVTAAFLGTPLALIATGLWLLLPLRRHLPHARHAHEHPLRELVRRAAVPVVALGLVAWLQDGNVIVVKHLASDEAAGDYAAAAVAAKAIMWVAIGLSLYLVPEAARRTHLGERASGVLARTLGLIGVIAAPMVLVYAVGGETVLRIAFKLTGAADALPWLGLAMSMLALTYLAVQYQLALHKAFFIVVLAVAGAVQPVAMIAIGGDELRSIALGLLGVNLALAVAAVLLAFRAVAHVREIPDESATSGALSGV
ncbi:MAG: oligosaccharide flippase family protein [Actinomycetota bacterium]|nr:oligosaccharide flippase family protein [Actinomycetota bacterium]